MSTQAIPIPFWYIDNHLKFFPFINFENPLYFWVGKGGLGAALPDQLGSQNFTWLSIYKKGVGIAWVLIHTKSMCFLCPPNV